MTVLAAVLLTAGCSTRRVSGPAPVEDRGMARSTEVAPAAPLPGAENAGKPGFYTVKAGDTLFRIALDHGQNWRDIQSWNSLSNPNALEVGQVLRVLPPAAAVAAPAPATVPSGPATSPIAGSGVTARPLTEPSAPAPIPPAPAPQSSAGADEITFIWPAQGQVITPFDETNNKGISIAGKIGDPVVAAADGRVVYAGAGLRGYGNLIILKHNNTYLTAYAHNQALLVREDQAVRQGQKIAEMGSSDTDRVKLHFEVRRLGKPVDPMGHLPKR
ncbi:peptidoglycan DD-metalloendopeptidase family protein [Hydrogenophaga sp.]|uniref:peptidoglycan DD-metalloendopeptidase family protein n=1 Tax=Hydrogenophaga sp. TaxID=1904254 RepID=UPI002637D571|nr:peptidoglycan DD-metalloendopeptidase family protein [Hydrogenophaga sp.]MCW5652652.1 peptidoglycan DD-metalloendopeptidase family protein [Hydrogenophaga sp.]